MLTAEGKAEAERLAEEYGYWGEHPDYPSQDWRETVLDGDTRLGYWEWIVGQIDGNPQHVTE